MKDREFNIWQEQRELNRVMNTTNAKYISKENIFNYQLALISEISEHMDCYAWKHWSKEAKDGKRWMCVDPQNAKVEVIDILFFVLSLMQSAGIKEDDFYRVWDKAWKNKKGKVTQVKAITLANDLLRACLKLKDPVKYNKLGFISFVDFYNYSCDDIPVAMVKLLKCYFASESDAEAVYKQKLNINYARMKRGRKQFGDKLSEKENKTIK